MRKLWFASVSLAYTIAVVGIGVLTATALDTTGSPVTPGNPTVAAAAPQQSGTKSDKTPAREGKSEPVKLSEDWAKIVSVEDLTTELSYSADRIAQNIKKQSDYDRFLKNIKAEAHLSAILAELVKAHPEAGEWKAIAADVQGHALDMAQAAEAKGAKNYQTAQQAHKKIAGLLKKGDKGGKSEPGSGDAAPADWAALGELSHVMKRVDASYKSIRGRMNQSAFQKGTESLRHEAAILATLSEIAPAFRPGEKDFVKFAGVMKTAAREEAEAAKDADFQKANAANTAINGACNDCHKLYRLDQSGKKGLDF